MTMHDQPIANPESPELPLAAWQDTAAGKSDGYYHPELHEFVLRYEDVRKAASPAAALMDFLESTYAASANAGKWDRANLERTPQK